MTALDVIISALAATLAGTGMGGGGVLIIYLSLARGINQLACQGINLFAFLSSAAGAVPLHAKRRKMDIAAVIIIGAVGALFSFFGFRAANMISRDLLRGIFGAFLVFGGMRTLWNKN